MDLPSARKLLLVLVLCRVGAALGAEACPTGQVVTADTFGKCCWPGQAWSRSRKVCIGVPTACPAGFSVQDETCARSCPNGQVVTLETRGQCCWPGQVWSAVRKLCVGAPTACPEGLVSRGDTCADTSSEWAVPPPPGSAPGPAPLPAPPPPPQREPDPEPPPPPPPDSPPPPPPPPPGPLQPPPPPSSTPAPGANVPPPPPTPPAQSGRRPIAEVKRDEETGPPRRVRVALITGVYFGEALGFALGLPIRIGVYTINPRERFQGTALILIDPWLWVASRARGTTRDLSFGFGLNVGAGWEQRLGPVEFMARFAVTPAFDIQTALTGSSPPWSIDFKLRGLVGLRFAVPSGEYSKFLLGIDAFWGGPSFWVAYIGVGF